jgi:hypothetical protein
MAGMNSISDALQLDRVRPTFEIGRGGLVGEATEKFYGNVSCEHDFRFDLPRRGLDVSGELDIRKFCQERFGEQHSAKSPIS